MTDSDLKIFAAQLGKEIPELDLHRSKPNEAEFKVDQFIYKCNQGGNDVARIIYGGGKGVLRELVLNFLNKHQLVEKVEEENGSCIVKLLN